MKKTVCQCLKKCLENFVKKMLADVRVRSDGQGNVSGFSIFIAIIPSRLLCQIGTLSRFRKRKKFRRCLFTSSIKHDVRQFSCRSCCFVYSTYRGFFYVVVAVAVVGT